MDQQSHQWESASLPAREFLDARTDTAGTPTQPLNQVTGAKLTTADLRRTLLALKSLDPA